MEETKKIVENAFIEGLERTLSDLITTYHQDVRLDAETANSPAWRFWPASTIYTLIYHSKLSEKYGKEVGVDDYSYGPYTEELLDKFRIYVVDGAMLVEDNETKAKSLHMNLLRVGDEDFLYDPNLEQTTPEEAFSILKDILEEKLGNFREKFKYLGWVETDAGGSVNDTYRIATRDKGHRFLLMITRLKEDNLLYSTLNLAVDTSFESMVLIVKDIITALKED